MKNEMNNNVEVVSKSEQNQASSSVSKLAKNRTINYQENIIVHEDDESKYECAICHQKFKTITAIKAHMLKHDPGSLECPFCSKRIKDLEKYKTHIEKHRTHYNDEQCDKAIQEAEKKKTPQYKSIEDIIQHPELHQVQNINGVIESDNWQDNITCDEANKIYTCNICQRKFNNINSIKTHMMIHSKELYRCPICGTRTKNVYAFKQHVESHQSTIYKCNHCLQVFTSIEDLREHLATHMIYNMNKKTDYDTIRNPGHLEKGFTCCHCDKEFIDRKDFYHHIISIQNLIPECPADHFHLEMHDRHENKYYAKCAICGNKFFDIKTHIEKYHHIDYQIYLDKWNVEDYSNLPTMNPAYATPKNRVFFNLKPNTKTEHETDIRKRRNEMNMLEQRVKQLLPDNVIFADTKFYVPVHENKKMTQRNPDFILVPLNILDKVQLNIAQSGYLTDQQLYKQIVKVIEVFGDYWHSQKFTGMPVDKHEQHVKQLYAQAGFNCLTIWEHELQDEDTLKAKINQFINS